MPVTAERKAYILKTNNLTAKECVIRGQLENVPFSEHALRMWIRTGAIPVRQIGTSRKSIIYWPNVVKFLTCADGADNQPAAPAAVSGIRRID